MRHAKNECLKRMLVATLPTNDMICHFPFEPRFFGVGLLAMTLVFSRAWSPGS